jgi:hypothetical protein
VRHRRGDGTLGVIIPGEEAIWDSGFAVPRARIATIQIGAEVKVVSKAMQRQVDRVDSDLRHQVQQFKLSNRQVISVAIVGVNHAAVYRSLEATREYVSTGRDRHLHPEQEAPGAIRRLEGVRTEFDEFLILKFRATNMPPFPFEWIDETETRRDYTSALVRISSAYETRF